MSSTSSNTGEFTYNELMEQYVKATRLIEHLKSQRNRSKRAFDKAMDLVLKYDARIAELEAERRWRVVADGEFPELGEEVIFYDSIMERRLKGCLRKNGGVEWLSDEGYTFSSRDGRYSWITHWMPLPDPPEVQE